MNWVGPTAVVADLIMKGRTSLFLPETEPITIFIDSYYLVGDYTV
jgi:hypothetical protein